MSKPEELDLGNCVSPREAAEYLHVDRRTIRKALATGKMNCFEHPVTKYHYIPLQELRRFGQTLAEHAQRKKLRFKRMFLPMPAVTNVIRAWNQHPVVSNQPGRVSKKNRAVRNDGTPALRKAIKRARKLAGGTADVVKEIRAYLNFCRAGKAVEDRVDYSYKTLLGFLKRYCRDLKEKKWHWWRKSRSHRSKAASFVAKRFANYFHLPLGQIQYHHQDFQTVAKRCFELSRRAKGRLKPGVILQYTLACLSELPDDSQTPQTMASDAFWEKDLAWWLRREVPELLDVVGG